MNYSHSTPTPIDRVDKVDKPKRQTESLSRLSTLSYGVDARGQTGGLPHPPPKVLGQTSVFTGLKEREIALVNAFWFR